MTPNFLAPACMHTSPVAARALGPSGACQRYQSPTHTLGPRRGRGCRFGQPSRVLHQGIPAGEAGSVVLRQTPASKLANLFRIDVRDHALGLVTQQLGLFLRLCRTFPWSPAHGATGSAWCTRRSAHGGSGGRSGRSGHRAGPRGSRRCSARSSAAAPCAGCLRE